MTESRADLAERMVPVAVALVGAVHDGGPHEVARTLSPLTPDEHNALAVVLAAMVDPDQSPTALLAWVTWDEDGRPLPATSNRDLPWRAHAHATRPLLDRLADLTDRHVRHYG